MKNISPLLISVVIISVFCKNSMAVTETSVDVEFEILTGSGSRDYYAGDHFWYNITLTNSGNTAINTTFTVKVYNTTGDLVWLSEKDYPRSMRPNETTFLFPNITRSGREDEVNVYFFETFGTYSLELSSDISYLTYYRYYASGRYTFEYGKCRLTLDVMPSYQRSQNERWNQFLARNEEYMDQVALYIQESRIEGERVRTLAFISLIVSICNMCFAWWNLPREQRKRNYWFFMVVLIVLLFLVLLFFLEP